MKFEVNISKNNLFVLIGILIVLGSIIGVCAVVSHGASDVFLSNGDSVEDAITDIQNPDFAPGDLIIVDAGGYSYVGTNSKVLVKTFYMGQGGSANFSAFLSCCRSDKTARISYKINGTDVGDVCSTTRSTLCSTIISFDAGDKVELYMEGTQYCTSTLSDIKVGVSEGPFIYAY